MASSKEYLDFVLEQLSDIGDISYRAMMGEYIIYFKGKVIGGIYDERFLIKTTPTAIKLMPNAPLELPYPSGKQMLLVQDIEDKEFLNMLFNSIVDELPETKRKK